MERKGTKFNTLEVLIFDRGNYKILENNKKFCESLKVNYKVVDISTLNTLFCNKDLYYINYISIALNYAKNSNSTFVISSIFSPDGIMSKKMLALSNMLNILSDGKIKLLAPYCKADQKKINNKINQYL